MAGENLGAGDQGNPGGGNPNPGAGTPWYQGQAGVDSEMVGHWTNKGWHTKTAAEVAVEATRSWKEAERFVGMPKDEIVRLPKQPSPEDLGALYTRLGRPADAKGYDLTNVKFKDGTPLDEPFANHVREIAFKHGLPASAGAELAQSLVQFAEAADAADTATSSAALLTEREALKNQWGANMQQNMMIAQNAVRALGLDPAVVNTLEGAVGYSKVMEMFRNIGARIGEDRYIANDQGGTRPNGVMTANQATARKTELKNDPVWVKKFLDNDVEARREMEALDRLILGGAQPFMSANGPVFGTR